MTKTDEAQEILARLNLPDAQRNEIAALTFLALAGVTRDGSWRDAERRSLGIARGIMPFIAAEYGREYKYGTRETIRKQALHHFVQVGLADYNPDDPNLSTNSPKAHYAISRDALDLVQAYGSRSWDRRLRTFRRAHTRTSADPERRATRARLHLRLPDGTALALSKGSHNELQVAVIEYFIPRFAPNATVLYVGDTAHKALHVATNQLDSLGLRISENEKLPDIVLHDSARNWLFLIEAVSTSGPISPKRVVDLGDWLADSPVEPIFVTAFLNFDDFRRHASEIAWETEVWVADRAQHLIHFDGARFLGPPEDS